MDNKRVIVGLDIGSANIDVVIGVLQDDGEVKIVGLGTSPSDGIRKGVISNIDHTVKAIRKAVEEAENMAGFDVREAYVGVSGKNIKSLLAHGVVSSGKGKEFNKADMRKVIEHASTLNLPTDREILHMIPQGFTVDGQSGIKDPVGSFGVRLEGEVNIITATTASIQNIYKVMERAEIRVTELALSSLASAMSVMHQDEKELGVAVVDIGAGVTDVAVFVDDSIRYASCLDLGGENVSLDVAHGVSTPKERAEEIKRKNGSCKVTSLMQDEFVDVPGVGGREGNQVKKEFLVKVIRARMQEIFQFVAKDLQRSKLLEKLGGGIVLTGGAVQLPGTAELAEEIFGKPVRIGRPNAVSGLSELIENPSHATGVGLVMYGRERQRKEGKATGGSASSGNFMDTAKKVWSVIRAYI